MPTNRTLLLLVLSCSPLLCAQQQALRLQLQPDTTLRYVATTELVMNMSMPRAQNAQLRVDIHFDLQVGKKSQGDKTQVALTVRRLKVKIDNPPLSKVDYDSEQKDGDAGLLHELTALVGKSFPMRMDPRGHLTDVELPKDFPAAAAQLFGGDMGQFFADNFPELPEAAVGVGDRWQTVTTVPLRQSTNTTITVENRLDAIQGQRARVLQTLHVDVARLAPSKDVKIDLPLAEGSYLLDLESGALVEATTTIDVHTAGKQNNMPLDMRQHMVRTLRQSLQDPSTPTRPGEGR